MAIKYVPIDSVIPYENNPRKINDRAVDSVAKSLELYGWKQPIVVDSENVVVVGHTRLQAAQKLGMTEVPIIEAVLPKEKADEYRIVDNRSGEISDWDNDSLVMELREFDLDLLETYFPDVDLEISTINQASASEEDFLEAEKKIQDMSQNNDVANHTIKIVCPSCHNDFNIKTKTLPGVTDDFLKKVIEGG